MAAKFLKRSFFHPGKPKCEESEKYEERCEPDLNKLTGSCYCKRKKINFLWFLFYSFLNIGPDIKTWNDFQNWEVSSGYNR
jgi:hypothetical protein